jgi:NAD(P)H dehydrogenase (quinone)
MRNFLDQSGGLWVTGLTNMNEITGGSPYGASTLAKEDGSRQPSANDSTAPATSGRHVAQITAKLVHEH